MNESEKNERLDRDDNQGTAADFIHAVSRATGSVNEQIMATSV